MPFDPTDYMHLGNLQTVKINPIKTFEIYVLDGVTASVGLQAPFVEAGSSWKLTPVVLSNDTGGEETQGYNFEATIILPNADHLRLEQKVKYYQEHPDELICLRLGLSQYGESLKGSFLSGLEYSNPINSFPAEYDFMNIYPELTMTLEIEPSDMRNRTKITIKKFFKIDEDYATTLTSNTL
jgi:hypothetical protein